MSWAKVDDMLHAHPKVAVAGLEAMGLHVLAMSWVAAYQTDGEIAPGFPAEKANGQSAELVRRLLAAGLWEERTTAAADGGVPVVVGWKIHDWLKYNPSKSEAKQLAKARQKAGKLGGNTKANR